MDYNITYRKKDKGLQVIVSYKDTNGKWRQKSKQGFENNREGKKQAKIEALNIVDALSKSQTITDSSSITFKEFTAIFLKDIELYRTFKTMQGYTVAINRFNYLSKLKLKEITTLDIQKCVDKMTKEDLRDSSIKAYLKSIKTIFNSAINKYNFITTSPIKNIEIKSNKEQYTKKSLTDIELTLIRNGFKNTKYELIIEIAINTGMRIGEIMGLTWDNVDFKNNTIKVEKQWNILKNNTYGFSELKTKKSNRTIPIPILFAKYLKEHKNNSIRNINNRIINLDKTVYVTAVIDSKFKKLGVNASLHELRHTYASKLIENGIDFKTTAKILGHSVEQTMKTYSHVTDNMYKKAINVISNF